MTAGGDLARALKARYPELSGEQRERLRIAILGSLAEGLEQGADIAIVRDGPGGPAGITRLLPGNPGKTPA